MHLVVWGSASKATVQLLWEGLPETAVQQVAQSNLCNGCDLPRHGAPSGILELIVGIWSCFDIFVPIDMIICHL